MEHRVDDLVALLRAHLQDADPSAMRRWWAGLAPVERQVLIIASPGLVGGAGGVPARQRDEANRLHMLSDLDDWHEADEGGRLTASEQHLLGLTRSAQAGVESGEPGESVLVLLYRPDAVTGRWEVGVSLGDPEQCDRTVAVRVGAGEWDLAGLRAHRPDPGTAVIGWRGSEVALHGLLVGLGVAP